MKEEILEIITQHKFDIISSEQAVSEILDLFAVRRSILGALNGAKKNCLALKNNPHIDSWEYALSHGKLEGINKAIDIVKKYCAPPR